MKKTRNPNMSKTVPKNPKEAKNEEAAKKIIEKKIGSLPIKNRPQGPQK